MKRLLLIVALAFPAPAYAGNPALEAEHDRVMTNVVPPEGITLACHQSGPWNDKDTWGGQVIPTALDGVAIPWGFVVTLDGDCVAKWALVEGELTAGDASEPDDPLPFDRDAAIANLVAVADRYAAGEAPLDELAIAALGLLPPVIPEPPVDPPNGHVSLTCETIVVHDRGRLELGTPTQPAHCTVTFVGCDFPAADWTELGRGLLVMGDLSIWGVEKTPWLHVAANPRAGDAAITLESAPEGWAVGDEIVLPGCLPPRTITRSADIALADPDPIFREQHEVRIIAAIDGATVTLDRPLLHDLHHLLPPGKLLAVGNLTRSVVLRSADPARRAHVMVMPDATQEIEVGYATFDGLGRTTSQRHVTDPQKLEGEVIATTVDNIRGRYGCHFHKMGYDSHAIVLGCAFRNGLKWQLVNHGSNVDAAENVSFDCEGAHYANENGLEIGSFHHNLAVYAKGFGKNNAAVVRHLTIAGVDIFKRNTQWERDNAPVGRDQGWAGYGFWLHGPLVKASNNEIYGVMREGIAHAQASLEKDSSGQLLKLPVEIIPSEFGFSTPQPVYKIPFHAENNIVVGAIGGLFSYAQGKAVTPSTYEGGWTVNCLTGLGAFQGDHRRFDSIWVYCHPGALTPLLAPDFINAGSGVGSYSEVYGTVIHNCKVENYKQCIRLPEGTTTVSGDETLLKGMTGVMLDQRGNADATFLIDIPDAAFQAPDAEVIAKLTPAGSQATWKVGCTQNYKSDAKYLLPQAKLRLWPPGSPVPAEAVDVAGMQLQGTVSNAGSE